MRLRTLVGGLLLSGAALATPYSKTLPWKRLSFTVQSQDQSFTLQPKGLAASNERITQAIDGSVNSAQIGDLDGDHWPEMLVTWKIDSSHQGASVYSVNNGKSLSQVSFRPHSSLGTFSLRGNRLVHKDLATLETHYRLQRGEASKQLVAEKTQPSALDFGLPRGFSVLKMNRKADPGKDFSALGPASGPEPGPARLALQNIRECPAGLYGVGDRSWPP